jgi:hypothetical protein
VIKPRHATGLTVQTSARVSAALPAALQNIAVLAPPLPELFLCQLGRWRQSHYVA